MRVFLQILPLLAMCLQTLQAQFGASDISSKASIHSEKGMLSAGSSFTIGIKLDHPDGWYSYYRNPGSFGEAISVEWNTPEGVTVGPTQWTVPRVYESESFGEVTKSYTYGKSVTFLYTITVDEAFDAQNATIEGNAEWQICSKTGCIPEDAVLTLVFDGATTSQESATIITEAKKKLPSDGTSFPITASEENGSISFSYSAPDAIGAIKDAYFFSADTQVDAQSEQSIDTSANAITHLAKRNQGNETYGLEAPAIKESISGILQITGEKSTVAYSIDTPLKQTGNAVANEEVGTSAGKAKKAPVEEASDELIAKGASLYDADSKPAYVNLEGVKEKAHSLATALFSVFIGGLLLNLMPCVFPVLGLKVMGFVQQGGEDPRKIRMHGIVFAFGLLFCMWIIAALVITLNANWGVQLANPGFLAAIVVLLFLMGLNMAGVFEFGTTLTSVGGDLQGKKGYSGSFFSGVLTTLIATPCSGPFLGSTIGYALSQPPVKSSLIFTVFALGIAFPYIIFAFFPKLINALPRPGTWMITFKQAMSFLLFASAIFFLNGFATQTGISGTMWLLTALVVIAAASWIYGRWGTPARSKAVRYQLGYGLAALVAIAGIYMVKTASGKINTALSESSKDSKGLVWESWFPGKMELAREKKRITWIDYTAKWCATCQLNKGRVFNDDEVLKLIEEYDVSLVRADYTARDLAIENDLKRFDRRNIPVNILVPEDPDAPLIMLPELIGPEDALKALKAAKS